jgi:hypothetical protein
MPWNHKGATINVTSHGTFETKIGDMEITATTLEEVKAQIDKLPKDKREIRLPVVGRRSKEDSWRNKDAVVVRATLTGINRTSRELQFEGIPQGYELRDVLPDNEDNYRFLGIYNKVKQVFDELSDLVLARQLKCEGYGRIDPARYDEILQTLEAKYQESAKPLPKKSELALAVEETNG